MQDTSVSSLKSIDNDNTRVPGGLVYKHPSQAEYPTHAGHWTKALETILQCCEREEESANNPIVFFGNEKFVSTYDRYPKGRYHVLVMRRHRKLQHDGQLRHIKTLNDLEPQHLHELREFHSFASSIASRIQAFHATTTSHGSLDLRLGYHAIPSLEHLHLHIISSDFDSPCIKTHTHIASFIPPFFVGPRAVELHLESAFADSLVMSVRKKRAIDALENTPLYTKTGTIAKNVPEWKRLNSGEISETPQGQQHSDRRLNSLLGFSSFVEPLRPRRFKVETGMKRYIIYMAVRERQDLEFARCLVECKKCCHQELRHCLQQDGTRHITLFDGILTASQASELSFEGDFDKISIDFNGWQPWAAGCYLKLSEESERELKSLLGRIKGLPFQNGRSGKCDHLSIYRRRASTSLPKAESKTEFSKIRKSSAFSKASVDGVSIRIKVHGSAYDECLVLKDSKSFKST